MADNLDENPTDNAPLTEPADLSADGEVESHVQLPSNDESSSSQVEEELNKFRDFITTATAKIEKQLSEFSVSADYLRQTETQSKESLASIQTALSDANTVMADINSIVSEAKELPDQLSQIKDQIVLLHGTATSDATEIATIHTEIERLQSDVAVNATAVSQHKQTAITEAAAATAQNEAATSAAASTAKNQADSLATLTQVQGHFNQTSTFQQQISDALEIVKVELVQTKEASVSAKQSLELVTKDSDLVEAAKQKVTSEEKNVREARGRVEVLEQAIKATKATNDDIDACRKQYSELVKTIEGLLPGATSASLSSAFRDQKQSYDLPKIGYMALFVLSVVLLAFGQHFIPEESWMTKLTNPWEIMLAHLLQKSPVEVPLLLMLYFAFRAFTTADKLQQDYAYKERMATAFEGFKTQFANIDTPAGDDAPLAVLCIKLLTIIGQHPARFYDPKHIEDLPSGPQAAKQVQNLLSRSRSVADVDIKTGEEKPAPIEISNTAKL